MGGGSGGVDGLGGGGTPVAFGGDGGPEGAGGGLGGGGGLGVGGQIQSHALGGPSVDEDPSERVHESNQAVASTNIHLVSTELVSHPEMSALNDVA